MSTRLPSPKTSLPSGSRGAGWPVFGSSAIGAEAGAGLSQGWTVSGRFLACIQAGQVVCLALLTSSRPGLVPSLVLRGAVVVLVLLLAPKLKVSEGRPSFLRASLVVRLDIILPACDGRVGERMPWRAEEVLMEAGMCSLIVVGRASESYDARETGQCEDLRLLNC